MTFDVAPRPGRGVAFAPRLVRHVETAQPLHPRRHQHREARRERCEHRRGIVGVPVAGHERLAEADQPTGTEAVEERPVVVDPHEWRVGVTATDDSVADDLAGRELDPHRQVDDRPHEESPRDGGMDGANGRAARSVHGPSCGCALPNCSKAAAVVIADLYPLVMEHVSERLRGGYPVP